MDSTSCALHEALKRSTLQDHLRLHKFPLFKQILSRNISPEEYIHLLHAHLAFHAAFESFFAEIEERFPFEMMAEELLTKDLKNLGVSLKPPQLLIHNVPKNLTGYLGYCYVKQGATLGAQILKSHLVETPYINSNAMAYFTAYEHKNKLFWKQFLQHLRMQSCHVDTEKVCLSAKASFQFLYQQLSKTV